MVTFSNQRECLDKILFNLSKDSPQEPVLAELIKKKQALAGGGAGIFMGSETAIMGFCKNPSSDKGYLHPSSLDSIFSQIRGIYLPSNSFYVSQLSISEDDGKTYLFMPVWFDNNTEHFGEFSPLNDLCLRLLYPGCFKACCVNNVVILDENTDFSMDVDPRNRQDLEKCLKRYILPTSKSEYSTKEVEEAKKQFFKGANIINLTMKHSNKYTWTKHCKQAAEMLWGYVRNKQ